MAFCRNIMRRASRFLYRSSNHRLQAQLIVRIQRSIGLPNSFLPFRHLSSIGRYAIMRWPSQDLGNDVRQSWWFFIFDLLADSGEEFPVEDIDAHRCQIILRSAVFIELINTIVVFVGPNTAPLPRHFDADTVTSALVERWKESSR